VRASEISDRAFHQVDAPDTEAARLARAKAGRGYQTHQQVIGGSGRPGERLNLVGAQESRLHLHCLRKAETVTRVALDGTGGPRQFKDLAKYQAELLEALRCLSGCLLLGHEPAYVDRLDACDRSFRENWE
jgi:hypothetical protein